MTPSVAAAPPTVAPANSLTLVGTAVHDREWWATEAPRRSIDWDSIIKAHLDVLGLLGLVQREANR
jgi:hypothetical protein